MPHARLRPAGTYANLHKLITQCQRVCREAPCDHSTELPTKHFYTVQRENFLSDFLRPRLINFLPRKLIPSCIKTCTKIACLGQIGTREVFTCVSYCQHPIFESIFRDEGINFLGKEIVYMMCKRSASIVSLWSRDPFLGRICCRSILRSSPAKGFKPEQ